ncbi:hypothetical protein ANN_12529 [Periplaneta americana]|uniref:Reverse transcriptase n=1 Tax=Periplaneta americana TaxID=6978 RepID=A0ABQ8THD4_PERAM|nr:hypothetical protein ANN_12529 [Periplaneta americana]
MLPCDSKFTHPLQFHNLSCLDSKSSHRCLMALRTRSQIPEVLRISSQPATIRFRRDFMSGIGDEHTKMTPQVERVQIRYCDCKANIRHQFQTYKNQLQHTYVTLLKLNEDIDSIVTWTKKLRLKINPGKTQAIILGHKRQTDAVKHLDISPVKHLNIQNQSGLDKEFTPANKWMRQPDHLTSSEWRLRLKMTANVCPLRAIPGRSRDGNQCRRCVSEIETLGHVLGACPFSETLWNSRNHRIRSMIVEVLRKKGLTVHEEVHGISQEGSCRRIDMLAKSTQKNAEFMSPHVDEIGDSEMIFGEMSRGFTIDYLPFTLRLGKTSEKPNQSDKRYCAAHAAQQLYGKTDFAWRFTFTPIQDGRFQQDGATAHISRASMAVLCLLFSNRLISRFGGVPWLPWSPDLSTTVSSQFTARLFWLVLLAQSLEFTESRTPDLKRRPAALRTQVPQLRSTALELRASGSTVTDTTQVALWSRSWLAVH